MSITLHSASAPLFQRQLGSLLAILDKAQAHAEARGFSADNYLQLRLAPDMLPFVAQIRIASDSAKGAVARLAGVDNPVFADDETTFEQLKARIRKTLDFIATVPAEAIVGQEARPITIPLRNREPLQFEGEPFLKHWALPNFFFHVSMAYALLRQAGVALGKADYLGA